MIDPMNPDSESVYDEQIAPLMKKIIKICKKNRIPMICSFQFMQDNDDKGAAFCTTRLPFANESESLGNALKELRQNQPFFAFAIKQGTK